MVHTQSQVHVQSLERKLQAAQTKYQDFEDVVLQLEREKGSNDRQLETLRQQLEREISKRAQIEKNVSAQKGEIARLKDINVKLDRDLNKALKELKTSQWEFKQLEAKQDKTIVEHVHVLEEAKRVTDGLLADAQATLREQASYIRSLENNKKRLQTEAEDASRERERELVELRTKVRSLEAHRQAASRAQEEVVAKRQTKPADDTRQHLDLEALQQRLAEEMADERKQHQKDLEEREFAADQTRKKYQSQSHHYYALQITDIHDQPSLPS